MVLDPVALAASLDPHGIAAPSRVVAEQRRSLGHVLELKTQITGSTERTVRSDEILEQPVDQFQAQIVPVQFPLQSQKQPRHVDALGVRVVQADLRRRPSRRDDQLARIVAQPQCEFDPRHADAVQRAADQCHRILGNVRHRSQVGCLLARCERNQ
jgi:hypothetical protein